MTVPFISVEDLATATGQELDEDRATIAVDAACESIRTYLNRRLNLASETKRYDGSGTDSLLLPWPIVEVTSVTLYPDDADFEEELTETDWIVGDGILYRVGAVWPRGRRNVEVEFTSGYAVTEGTVDDSGEVQVDRMPSDIRAVALELADQIYSAGSSVGGSGDTSSFTVGPDSYSETFDVGSSTRTVSGGGLNDGQKERLDPYRAVPV